MDTSDPKNPNPVTDPTQPPGSNLATGTAQPNATPSVSPLNHPSDTSLASSPSVIPSDTTLPASNSADTTGMATSPWPTQSDSGVSTNNIQPNPSPPPTNTWSTPPDPLSASPLPPSTPSTLEPTGIDTNASSATSDLNNAASDLGNPTSSPATPTVEPQTPTWTLSPNSTPSEPTPTLNSGQLSNPDTPPRPASPVSNLDNPLKVPFQNPAIDGGLTNQSTNPSPTDLNSLNVQPPVGQPAVTTNEPSSGSGLGSMWSTPSSPTPIDLNQQPLDQNNPPPVPPEPVPTDLSHLIGNSSDTGSAAPQIETLVASQPTASPDIPQVPVESNGKKIPVWLIGLSVGLLIAVAGASAYFILGVGQSRETTSLPATQTEAQQVRPPAPIPPPVSNPAATESANFGELDESPNTPQATSAAELLRQRQNQTQ